jgi:acyl-CoA synthetase (NDP forming)
MTARAPSPVLSPLFAPTSIAVFGASNRPGRPGHQVLAALKKVDPEKTVYPITPRYEEILGYGCAPRLKDVPAVDLAIIASGTDRIEAEVDEAIDCGARSLLIFGAPKADASRAGWLERVGSRASEAGVPLLGPDSLGFVDFVSRTAATWALPDQVRSGAVAVISQSGTVFWEATTNDPRLRFSFTAHSGLESALALDDLIGYALELEATRVIGLYVETVRNPEGFADALAAAAAREVPVVALYAGRTERSRAQMMTHAGRLAGDRASLEGLFRRHGVARVDTNDEWWTTLALLGMHPRLKPGGLAAVMDSGGGLAQFLDFAEELGVPLAALDDETRRRVDAVLGYEGLADSVLDFWVGDADRHAHTEELVTALAENDGTAAVMAFTTYGESGSAGFAVNVADACLGAARRTSAPIIAATYTSRQVYPELMMRLSDGGIPVLDGMRNALLAARHAFAGREFRGLQRWRPGAGEDISGEGRGAIDSWQDRLDELSTLNEADALALLADFGVPTVPTLRAVDLAAALAAARELGFPVVLKTDEGIAHKAAMGGVRLNIAGEDGLTTAYRELADALGPKVVVASMASGIEVALGIVAGQFGPTLVVGAGGTLIESSTDRCYLLAPVSPDEVRFAMADLHISRTLAARFGPHGMAIQSLYDMASRVSALASIYADTFAELDVNPVLVGEDGCLAVDALLRLRARQTVPESPERAAASTGAERGERGSHQEKGGGGRS